MQWDEFASWGKRLSDWGADYRTGLRSRPVRPKLSPGAIAAQLPPAPPETGTGMEAILKDFEDILLPGMTHWQHPRFFAYFPSNAAPPAVLGEYLTAILSAQCMLWQTSPAATELETLVMDWMRQATGLPEGLHGVIQDSASSATLAAVLTMRERALDWAGNREGLFGQKVLRIYATVEAHSSIDRAIWFAGIGSENLVRVPLAGSARGMDPAALRAAIEADRAAGHLPAGIIANVGGTSAGACDDIREIGQIAAEQSLFLHVDAAWAGSAMIMPEWRHLWDGIEMADSIVFNPHKWLGVPFDCSAHFVKEPELLTRTLSLQPEFLLTGGKDGMIDYSEWSIPLGRRFRALKLWMLIRYYGMEGLRSRMRNHITWSQSLAKRLEETRGIEIVTPPFLSLFTFRLETPERTRALLEAINDDGRIYLTQTLVDDTYAIRFQAGQFETTQADLDLAYDVITSLASALP